MRVKSRALGVAMKVLPLVCLLVLGFSPRSAWASGDFACEPVWSLDHAQLDDCSNIGFLSPGNDSRINLQMLMLDQRALPAAAPDRSHQVLFSLGEFSDAMDDTVFRRPSKAPGDAAARGDLAEGEGSRCVSDPMGSADFVAALDGARGLPTVEKAALAAARDGVAPTCMGGAEAKIMAAALPVKSAPGKVFAAYLAAAAAFYDGDFDSAHAGFTTLSNSNLPWIKEAARYMLGRVELNRAQIGAFDEFGSKPAPGKVDVKSLAAAETAFQSYLRDYPKGTYAASARGLLRRLAWLGGRRAALAAEYARLIAEADWAAPDDTPSGLAREIDNKLLDDADPAPIKAPVLLAALDLMGMRGADTTAASDPGPPAKPSLSLAALEAQRPLFAKDAALFDYLLAAHKFYVEKDPAGALALLLAQPPRGSYLDFSRQVLRGLALEALKDKTARAHWIGLYPAAHLPGQAGAVELALAMNYERQGDLAPIFEAGSLVQNVDVRSIVLSHDAGAPLLRARVRASDGSDDERRLALYVLLYKELTRGRYAAFLQDLALLPSPPPAKSKDDGLAAPYDLGIFGWSGAGPDGEAAYACPPLRAVAKALSQHPMEARARLCLAEFVRENVLDGFALNKQLPAAQLGGTASQFPGADPARLEIYKAVIADPKAPVTDKSYALYRAVNCYAPSGYNHCDGEDVSKAQRKQWFKTLKTNYAATPWADALKYYW